MTERKPTVLADLVRHTFTLVETKDLEGLMGVLADDALLIDPHFPQPRMEGKVAIRKGFGGAMRGMTSFGYTIDECSADPVCSGNIQPSG